MTNKLYSIREVAELLGISRAYAYLLKDMGKIKTEKIGSQYVITQKELDRYKEKSQCKSPN